MSTQAADGPPPQTLPPLAVRRVLVIRPRFLGDLCLALPVLDHLARHVPHAAVDILAEEPYAALLDGDPRLHRVLRAHRRSSPARTASLFAALHATEYDVVLDLFCNPRTALWTLATAAPVRVGYAGKGWRSRAYNRHPVHRGASAIAFHLASIEALGWEVDRTAQPRLRLPPAEIDAARARRIDAGVPAAARWVAVHPGARWPTRQWPAARYAALVHLALAAHDDVDVLVLAGPGEEDLARTIVAMVNSPRAHVVGGLSVRELAALFAGCVATVAADSGPLHVSVAAGTPTVGIFGRNEPERFFPYATADGHRVAYAGVWCSPCHLDVCPHTSCLRAITPEWVMDALAEILARRPAAAVATGATR
jgi:ADP-heptose:LPS heptosyltransferase